MISDERMSELVQLAAKATTKAFSKQLSVVSDDLKAGKKPDVEEAAKAFKAAIDAALTEFIESISVEEVKALLVEFMGKTGLETSIETTQKVVKGEVWLPDKTTKATPKTNTNLN